MKKITNTIFSLLLISGAITAQTDRCGTMESHSFMLANDSEYAIKREQIREQTNQFVESYNPLSASRALVTIPVVFHVVYQNATENISDAQLLSQIQVLNDDFRKLNSNFSQTPSVFQGVAADMEFEFCLASIDPQGNATNGITRTQTTTNSFNTNNNVKRDNNGGKSPWNTAKYLNIWVCDLGSSLLGYAQFPGGNPNTDGVVITYTSVGKPPANPFNNAYNLGRTATHEVGHWLNLYHIWGDDDGACNGTDEVSDTPNQGDSNGGCPNFPRISCNNGPNGDMFMNYMDYMDDDCATMFTNGQKARAQALFGAGGVRVGLLTSNACANQPEPPVNGACADTVRYPFVGTPVVYGDETTGYVGGTNIYDDKAKADKFTVSGSYNILTNAWFGFSFADAGNVSNHQVT
ncbi:MAG: zinc metalloprotease, partial [Bacteroidia bacterium]